MQAKRRRRDAARARPAGAVRPGDGTGAAGSAPRRVAPGDGEADRAVDGRARHRRHRGHGRAAALVPEDVRGEPLLARPGRAGRHRRRSWTGSSTRSGAAARRHRGVRHRAPRAGQGGAACSRRWRWSGSSSTWSRPRSTSWPRPAARPSCARRSCATRARSRSAPPRSTRAPPRRAAPGTPGWRRWSSTRWCAARRQESLHSWASALNWSSSPVAVIAGTLDGDERRAGHRRAARDAPARARLDLLAGVQGSRLIVVLGGTDDPMAAAEQFAGRFGPGPLVVGPRGARPALGATRPPRAALAGLRAAPAWPDAPRPVSSPTSCCPSARSTATRTRVADLVDERLRAAAGRRRRAARHADHLPGAGVVAGGHRPDAVRPPEHGPLPAAPGHRADRATPRRRPDGFTLWVAIILGRLAARRG